MVYEGSHIEYEAFLKKNVMVPMRDGVKLATDIYFPSKNGIPVSGRFPSVVERTPYDNSSIRLTNIGRFYARRGYVCVLQDVRGRGESEGDWFFLLNPKDEGRDGYDLLDWIVRQDWSDGQIGTIGLSYTGATQQALAVTNPPGLKTQFIMDSGYNYHTHTIRSGGAFNTGVLFPYAFRMARDGKEAQSDPLVKRKLTEEFHKVPEWFSKLPLKKGDSPLSLAPSYEDFLLTFASHGDYDGFWKNPASNLEDNIDSYPDIPIFLLTSWYGHHVWATTTKYMEFMKRLSSPVRMIIGTWLHGHETLLESWSGEVDFGVDAILDNIEDLRLKWFDHFLKGMKTDVLDGDPIQVFIMGGGTGKRDLDGRMTHGGHWRTEKRWPVIGASSEAYFLHANGILDTKRPISGDKTSEFTFDPEDPVPTIGGCVQNPKMSGVLAGGAFDQTGRPELFFACKDDMPLENRQDVLVFQTSPLEEDIEVTGFVEVRLFASSSATDTDFTAKLLDVYPASDDYPNGFAMNLCDGIIRGRYRLGREKSVFMERGEISEFKISLQATGNLFKIGHRIRLDISSSSFPQFDVNPNTGDPLWSSDKVIKAYQIIYHSMDYPSKVILPVISRG